MILDVIDYLYALSLDKDIRKPNRLKFIPRNIIKVLVNVLVPVYYSLTGHFYRIIPKDVPYLIVSLTSFPARIKTLHIVIESLMRQRVKPDRLMLWLSKEQFPDERKSLPKNLLDMERRGLEIFFVEDDLRPHKKYFYAMQQYPEADVITVDDDIFYPQKLLKYLVDANKKYPACVCCNRAIRFTLDNGKLKSYIDWKPIDFKEDSRPNYRILPTGVGGVLYPHGSLKYDILFDKETIKTSCLNADDLWLNLMARFNNTRTVHSGKRVGLIPLLSTKSSALSNNNIFNGNDLQIQKLKDYFGENGFMYNLKN